MSYSTTSENVQNTWEIVKEKGEEVVENIKEKFEDVGKKLGMQSNEPKRKLPEEYKKGALFDFFNANKAEILKKGNQWGTTDPSIGYKVKSSMASTLELAKEKLGMQSNEPKRNLPEEYKKGALFDFFNANRAEVLKKGNQWGTTSPTLGYRVRSSVYHTLESAKTTVQGLGNQFGVSSSIQPKRNLPEEYKKGALFDFFNANRTEIVKKGTRWGTTDPTLGYRMRSSMAHTMQSAKETVQDVSHQFWDTMGTSTYRHKLPEEYKKGALFDFFNANRAEIWEKGRNWGTLGQGFERGALFDLFNANKSEILKKGNQWGTTSPTLGYRVRRSVSQTWEGVKGKVYDIGNQLGITSQSGVSSMKPESEKTFGEKTRETVSDAWQSTKEKVREVGDKIERARE